MRLRKRLSEFIFSYMIIEGILAGVLVLNEFIFIKSLKGSNYQLSVLFQFSLVLLFLSVFMIEYLKRYKNKAKLLVYTGLLTRLPLLVLLFFPGNVKGFTSGQFYHYIFLTVFFIYYMAQPVVMPIIIQYLKTNYRHENMSKLYSYATMVNKIMMLVITFLFGLLLDFDNYSFRYIYACIGILGVFSIYLLSKIQCENNISDFVKVNILESFRNSWRSFISILKKNKPFRDYEIGFMLYGYAWISTMVLINLYYYRVLHLNYSSTAFYKNIFNLVSILTLPTFGRLFWKTNMKKFSVMTYSFLFFMIIFTALTQYYQAGTTFMGIKLFYLLLTASLAFGLFSGAMPLLWDIGSTYFCKQEETDKYMSVHMTLTGVRGFFSPFLGIWIFEQTGYSFTFGVAAFSLLAAMIYVYLAGNNLKAYSAIQA